MPGKSNVTQWTALDLLQRLIRLVKTITAHQHQSIQLGGTPASSSPQTAKNLKKITARRYA